MTSQPPDTAVDAVILQIAHEAGLVDRGMTISADSFPDAKAKLKALMVAERLDELNHVACNDEDGTWIEDIDKWKKEGQSPSFEVWERIEQLQAALTAQQPTGDKNEEIDMQAEVDVEIKVSNGWWSMGCMTAENAQKVIRYAGSLVGEPTGEGA